MDFYMDPDINPIWILCGILYGSIYGSLYGSCMDTVWIQNDNITFEILVNGSVDTENCALAYGATVFYIKHKYFI